jgi:hypothetical protein
MGLPHTMTFVLAPTPSTFFSVFMTGDKSVLQQENIAAVSGFSV